MDGKEPRVIENSEGDFQSKNIQNKVFNDIYQFFKPKMTTYSNVFSD